MSRTFPLLFYDFFIAFLFDSSDEYLDLIMFFRSSTSIRTLIREILTKIKIHNLFQKSKSKNSKKWGFKIKRWKQKLTNKHKKGFILIKLILLLSRNTLSFDDISYFKSIRKKWKKKIKIETIQYISFFTKI